ncbi:MAG: 1-deoxy-D-xylulose-5-phosphate synthase [Planctomycetota bacterium]
MTDPTRPAGPPPPGKLLDRVRGSEDLRGLTLPELNALAGEIRELIKHTVARTGGHLATNLGAVELTLALHRVFDFKRDRLVFDVGHQCYTHKIITGRRERFATLRTKEGLSGYPNRQESPYDTFNAGHAGTAISAALGLACGDGLAGTDRRVVVLIGDGSIPTGLSFEGLNQLGHLKRNLIIILNDNEMSISPTVGALAQYLTRIRTGTFYNEYKARFKQLLRRLPHGSRMDALSDHLAANLVKSVLPGHFFAELGLRYFGPVDGHDLTGLEEVLKNCLRLDGPILVHAITTKGHGYEPAKEDPESYHGAVPFNVADGSALKTPVGVTYSEIFAETLTRLAENDTKIVAITAAMPLGTGLNVFQDRHPGRFFDVGICEQHAVTFAAGLSDTGLTPVVGIYSTFLQRSYDQVFHDVSMQDNMHVVFAMDRAGLVGSDGYSHHGLVDISMMRVFPGLILMAPRDRAEFELMLAHAVATKGIFAIRYPRETAPARLAAGDCPPIVTGRGEILRRGRDVAVLAYGAMVTRAMAAAESFAAAGVEVTVANARFAKPLDGDLIRELAAGHRVLVTVEDHMVAGGFGSAVLEHCHAEGIRFDSIRVMGVPDRYIAHATREEQLAEVGLDAAGIVRVITEERSRL